MDRFDKAPDRYWHCRISRKGDRWAKMSRDMTKQDLLEKIVQPWREQRPFFVGSTLIREHSSIESAKIVRTSKKSAYYVERAHARNDLGFAMADFREGEDFTHELLTPALSQTEPSAQSPKQPSTDVSLLLQLCARLPLAAKPLARRRKGKGSLKIGDEYDAQDLLQAIIRAYFQHAISEEPIKKLANTKSTRADLAIEALGTIIELKYVRDPNDQSRIVDELALDLLYYEQWEHLRTFVYLIYNASNLSDPEALDGLSGVRMKGDRKYDVHIVRA